MILAAGRGKRMKPLTDNLPKPLLKVKGKALIVHHLEKLAKAGFVNVVINVAWLGHQIMDELGDGSKFGLSIQYCDEGSKALETAGGIINALDYLDNQFWVINADVYSDFEIEDINLNVDFAHLILVKNPEFNSNGDFGIEHGKLLNKADQTYTFSGIGYYSKQFFEGQMEGKSALAPLIRKYAEQGKVAACLYEGIWSDVGTPERLAQLNN